MKPALLEIQLATTNVYCLPCPLGRGENKKGVFCFPVQWTSRTHVLDWKSANDKRVEITFFLVLMLTPDYKLPWL